MEVISFPFRLTPTGSVATVTHRSDAEGAQLIAGLMLTHQGELPLALGFGQAQQTFGPIDISSIAADIARYYPHLKILDIKYKDPDSNGRVRLEIEFDVKS